MNAITTCYFIRHAIFVSPSFLRMTQRKSIYLAIFESSRASIVPPISIQALLDNRHQKTIFELTSSIIIIINIFSTIRHEISRLLSLDVETRKLEERRTVASGKSSSNHASLVHQHESQQKNDVKWILNWQTLTALWRKEAENNFEELLSQRLNWINKFSFKWTEWNVSLSKGMEILREKQIRWFHDEA